MFAVTVRVEDLLEGRLNSEAYAPDILVARAVTRRSGLKLQPLQDLVRAPINNSIRDVSDELDTPGSTVPMFRPADIADGWCDQSTAPKLSLAFEAMHAKSRVQPGDIVLGIAGTIAVAGRVPPGAPHGNINGSSARIAPKLGIEGYLLSYLNSRYGRSAMLQWAVGAVQRHLNLEDLPGVEVVTADEGAQRYIGSKVRQAEVLRDREAGLTRLCFEMVTGLFPGVKESDGLTRQPSRTLPHQLVDRLNAEAYAVDYLSDDEVLARTGLKQRPLGDLVTAPINNSIRGVTEALGQLDGEIPMFRPADILGLWASAASAPNLPRAFEAEHAKSRVLPGDIVLSIAGTIGTAGRVPPTVKFGNINGSSARLRVLEDFRGYLLVLLNTPLGRRLTTRWAVGAVQKHLNLEDLPGILIPLAAEPVLRTLNEHVSQAEHAYLGRRQLITAARLLVEALIERKVTEAELIAASKDPAADRALLARLAEDGLDGSGRPLFSDLDALQALLAEAKPQDPQ